MLNTHTMRLTILIRKPAAIQLILEVTDKQPLCILTITKASLIIWQVKINCVRQCLCQVLIL